MNYILTTLYEFLCKSEKACSIKELNKLLNEYSEKLNASENDTIKAILESITRTHSRLIEAYLNEIEPIALLSDEERLEFAAAEEIINNNLFDYHFQPIINTTNGEIYSYEALMRPKSEICRSPLQILKYAKMANKLTVLEGLTFINILNIFNDNEDIFKNKKIFINSIPEAMLSDNDLKAVSAIIRKHPDKIVIEMTEQSEMNDEQLNEIRGIYEDLNMRLAIDDYGTGYSNIQNLFRYTPDYVKIDRSLISNIHNEPNKQHFVREIIEFCHENDILALAEGVETRDELHMLILLGVNLIQGYYTAKPSKTILNAIDPEIKNEIIEFKQERDYGQKIQTYIANKSERILLDKLSKKNYKRVIINKDNSKGVTLAGIPGVHTKIQIDIQDDFKGSIILENIDLSNEKGQPCISINNNCDVKLILVGNNILRSGGIRVPENSKLNIVGDGGMTIYMPGECTYGIGNDLDSKHGELTFNQGVNIESTAATCVCIGSGLGGKINIAGGQYKINMIGTYGVGIGAYNSDADLDLFACDINIDCSLTKGVGIGTLDGDCRTYVHSSAIKLHLSGETIIGIGTIYGKKCDVEICEATSVFNILADTCSAIAALNNTTTFNMNRAGIHILTEGANALSFGGFNKNTEVNLTDSDTHVRLTTSDKYAELINKDCFKISNGRTRIIVNNKELI